MLFPKYLNTQLKLSLKHQLRKLRLEFHHKFLSCFYLTILSNYLTWCITVILLSGNVETNPGFKSSSRQCFLICHWNLTSISAQSYTKVSLLAAYNLTRNFDIICISDTFLNSETAPNDPNLEILGYSMYCADNPSN